MSSLIKRSTQCVSYSQGKGGKPEKADLWAKWLHLIYLPLNNELCIHTQFICIHTAEAFLCSLHILPVPVWASSH